MAKLSSSCKKNNGIVKLNSVAKRLKKSLLLGKRSASYHNDNDDVPEGHFAVVAMETEESRRYVVPLCLLSNPTFLNLLEKAAEEYGFNCQGVITIPCLPNEFERILAEAWAF